MVENPQPLQMANDGKIKKWFPGKAQIQGITKQTNKPKKQTMVRNENWECDYKTFGLHLWKTEGDASAYYSVR